MSVLRFTFSDESFLESIGHEVVHVDVAAIGSRFQPVIVDELNEWARTLAFDVIRRDLRREELIEDNIRLRIVSAKTAEVLFNTLD